MQDCLWVTNRVSLNADDASNTYCLKAQNNTLGQASLSDGLKGDIFRGAEEEVKEIAAGLTQPGK